MEMYRAAWLGFSILILVMAACQVQDQKLPIDNGKVSQKITTVDLDIEAEYPFPDLIPAYADRLITGDSCKSELPLQSPNFKQVQYTGSIKQGDLTVTHGQFANTDIGIAYHEETGFSTIPVKMITDFKSNFGVLKQMRQPKTSTGEKWTVALKLPITAGYLIGKPTGSKFEVHGIQNKKNAAGEILGEKDYIFKVKFNGCSKTKFEAENYDTKIWTVQEISIEKSLFSEDYILDDTIYFFEYAPKLGWFTSLARSKDEIVFLQSIER